jgi:hypothetical protein
MTSRSKMGVGLAVLVAVAAGCAAPPMRLTKWLLADPEPHRRVGLREDGYWGDVRGVRGQLDAAPGARRLAVDVSFPDRRDLPSHLRTYGRAGSAEPRGDDHVGATFVLAPTHSRRRWPEDYVGREASRGGLALRLHGADYFGDGSVGGEVIFAGRVPRAALATRCRPVVRERDARGWDIGSLPASCASLTPLLVAIGRHRWGRLLGIGDAKESLRFDPVAWLGPSDRVLEHDEVAQLLAPWVLSGEPAAAFEVDACGLLLRCTRADGAVEFWRVPLGLLREGDALTLVGGGEYVAWTRREIWTARMQADAGASAAWPDPGLHLASAQVRYTWGDVVPYAGLDRVFASMLAPISAVIDVVAWTNPILQALVDVVVPESFKPSQSKR